MPDDNNVAIRVSGASKTFKLPHEKNNSIKEAVIGFYKRNKTFEEQQVLKNISFEIRKGEFFGIVGRNGSGKSTMLKMLAGIYEPSEGNIQVNGKLTPFIELGVGFNPELTGRENVFLNGALLGFNRKEMDDLYDEIVEFAELERFMDQKLKNYSSGMQVRLAFSIAIRAKSEILLIDEVLAVGDAAFQTKCFDYFQSLRNTNTTVVFVSHDRSSLDRFCERGILIDEGEIVQSGSIQEVLKDYSKIVMAELDNASEDEKRLKEDVKHSAYAEISDTITCNELGTPQKRFTFGDNIYVRYKIRVKKELINPIIGVTVFKKNTETAILATNTLIEGHKTGTIKSGEVILFQMKVVAGLNDGEYYVEPALANESASVFFDQRPKATTFFISGSVNPYSLLSTDNKIKIEKKA